jgi:hypothetical protein
VDVMAGSKQVADHAAAHDPKTYDRNLAQN